MVRVSKYERRQPTLTSAQKRIARKLAVSRVEEESPLSPFTPPTPENIATMPFYGRVKIPNEVDIPVPPQHPSGDFTDYEKEDAQTLARELRKLKGQPVILTGGGGSGAQIWFLQDVKVIAFPPCIRKPPPNERECEPSDAWKRGESIDPWYKPDPNADPSQIQYKVKVFLDNPSPVKGSIFSHDESTFDPWIGSWRITALREYGAEKIRKTWPAGWE